MIVKNKDDKSNEINLLKRLVKENPGNSAILKEFNCMRSGDKTESNAAYFIDFDFKQSDDIAIIHDLRIEIGDRIAQIDHLLIHRSMNIFVVETKAFSQGLKINESSEFQRCNKNGKTYEGMESPLSQNQRHIEVLKDAFQKIPLLSKMGMRIKPVFHSIILVSSNAFIDRPTTFNTENVIKVDAITGKIKEILNESKLLWRLTKMISKNHLIQVAESIAALDQPKIINYQLKFGLNDKKQPVEKNKQLNCACESCHGDHMKIKWAEEGGYWFHCLNKKCYHKQRVNVICATCNNSEQVRTSGNECFRECSQCDSFSLFFINPS